MADAASLSERPPMSRTHLADDDLAWVPLSVRAAGEFVVAVGFIAVVCLVLAVVVVLLFVAHVLWYGALFLGIIPAAYQFRDRVARAVMRGRMQRQRRIAAYLPTAVNANDGDGELVRVRGRIRAPMKIPALVDGRPIAFRRLVFRFYGVRAVHEAGTDFLLDDGSGEPVLIVIDGARLVEDLPSPKVYRPLEPAVLDRLEAACDPPAVLKDCFNDWRVDIGNRGPFSPAAGIEQLLREGDEVEVLGQRCRVVDQTVTARLERETPFRAALRGTDAMPLLIARCG